MLIESISGIRGIANNTLTDKVVANYVYAYFVVMRPKTVVVGMDTRPSSASFHETVLKTLPCEVFDIGVASTPVSQTAVRHFNAGGGIIITASHNEPEWNGLKFLDSSGAVVSPETAQQIIETYQTVTKLEKDTTPAVIHDKSDEAEKAYQSFVHSLFDKKNTEPNHTIVLDPNGGTGVFTRAIVEELGYQVVERNAVPGVFNRTIEPTQESLTGLSQHVSTHNALFGAGFDCDADRVEIVLKDGRVLDGNSLLALCVDHYLSEHENPSMVIVVVNDATSCVVKKIVEKHHATLQEVGVGEANVVRAMKESNSPIGGEGSSSGVIISPSTCRDGTVAILSILSMMTTQKQTVEELVDSLPPFAYVKEKTTIHEPFSTISKKIKQAYPDARITTPKDGHGGLKVWEQDAFVWFRQSKTEAGVLRIIADAPTQEVAQTLLKKALSIVNDESA